MSSNYLAKHWSKNIKASNNEIADYLTLHPEYDIDSKKKAAEKVLLRALAGEDFAKMAKELSEDRGSRDNGGLYADFTAGGLWPEIEAATLTMKNGEIAPRLIETNDGYHILKLEMSTGAPDDRKLTIRHILFQKRFEDPNSARFVSTAPAPFKTPVEIAKGEIERTKRQAFIDAIVTKEGIQLPEDFQYEQTSAN